MVLKNLKGGQGEPSQAEPVNTEEKSDTSATQDLLETIRLWIWGPKRMSPLEQVKDIGISEPKPDKADGATSEVSLSNLEEGSQGNILDEGLAEDQKNSEGHDLGNQAEKIVCGIENIKEYQVENSLESTEVALEEVEGSEVGKIPAKKSFRKLLIIPILVILSLPGYKLYGFITEPKPPSEEVVAAFSGKYLTKEELSNYISLKGYKDKEHGLCEKHGFDHSKCDKTEVCETHPIHSMEAYQQIIKMMAVQKIVDDWAKEKGVTQKNEVKHDFQHLVEEVSLDNLVDKVHKDQLSPDKIEKGEIQKYYDANKDKYKDRPFSEIEGEIRTILADEKDKQFFPEYIERLKKNAALDVNYNILKVDDPTEMEMRDFYEKNKEKYFEPQKARILAIQLDISGSEDEVLKKANEALSKIMSGESFEEISKRYSNSKQLDAFYVKQGEKGTNFEDKVFSLQVNEMSSVFKDGNSFYIVKCLEKQEKRQKTFGEALNEIKAGVLSEKEDKQYELRKNEALFSIHGKRFTLGEFKAEFKELSPETQAKFAGFEAKKDLIDQLIAKELLLEESGDDTADTESSKEIEELKSQYISQILHKEEIDEKIGQISDEEAEKFYEEKKKLLFDPPKALISLIRVETGTSDVEKTRARQRIDEALQRLKEGADFAAIAKEYSNDPTASAGGKIKEWLYDNDLLDQVLKKNIFKLQPEEISGVFEYEGGYYVVKLRQKEDKKQKTFEEVKAQLKEVLLDEKHLVKEAELENELLEKSQLVIYNSSLRKMLKEATIN